jgi:hypothetical protein
VVEQLGQPSFGAGVHGAELQHREGLAVTADPGLAEQRRSAAGQANNGRHDQQERGQDDEGQGSTDDVEAGLDQEGSGSIAHAGRDVNRRSNVNGDG